MRLMTTAEVARLAGVSEPTVRWWERTGKLMAERTGSGLRLFTRVAVEKFLRERTQQRRADG